MKVFSLPVTIAATAYIRAATAAEAVAKLNAFNGYGGEFPSIRYDAVEGLPVSGASFAGPYLPDISLSPAFTLYSGDSTDEESRPDPGDAEEVHDDDADDAPKWSGSPDPADPDNFWIDDKTGERVNAATGERNKAEG